MSPSLRTLLYVDAATCGGMGVVLAIGSGLIADLARLPAELVFYTGLVLLPIAAFMAFVAARPVPPVAGVWLIVVGNVLWVAASGLLLVSGLISPNALGWAFVIAQALVVAVLARLEFGALRSAPLHSPA